jgi:hypothetical protein
MFTRSVIAFLYLASASAFTPIQTPVRSETSLGLFPKEDVIRKVVTSFAAGAVILSNVAVAPVIAYDTDFGSSQVIAARSGGRSGGRAASRAPVRSSPRQAPPREVIRETNIIRESPSYGGAAVMAPPPMMMQPAAPSFPGLGLVAGFGAMNAIGDGMRENRQENEIRDARQQVVEARIKEAELDARLKAMEAQVAK